MHEGIKPDVSKVEIMSDFPAPTMVMEVRRLLGLSGFYGCFVKNYSKLAHPLTELTKKPRLFGMKLVRRPSMRSNRHYWRMQFYIIPGWTEILY